MATTKRKTKSKPLTRIELDLLDAPTTAYQAGLGGLALVLNSAGSMEDAPLNWEIMAETITLEWKPGFKDAEVLQWLCERAYKIDENGLIHIPQLQIGAGGDRANVHNVLMGTLLSHPLSKHRVEREWTAEEKEAGKRSNKQSKFKFESKTFSVGDGESPALDIVYKFYPVEAYAFQNLPKLATGGKEGKFKKSIDIKSWLLPGASQKHELLGATRYSEDVKGFIQLMFLPVACDYFQIRSRLVQDKARFAVVIPAVTNLEDFIEAKKDNVLDSAQMQVTAGEFDAAFLSLNRFAREDVAAARAVEGCEVLVYGDRPWNTKFKILTARQFVEFDRGKLYRLNLAKILKPGIRQGKNGTFISVYFGREIVTENILRGFYFYAGLANLIRESTDYLNQLSQEGKKLRQIYEESIKIGSEETPEVSYYAQKWADGFNYLLFCLYGATQAYTAKGSKANYKRVKERLQMDLRFIETQELFEDWLQKLRSNPTFRANPFWNEANDPDFNPVQFEMWLRQNWKLACNLTALMILGYENPWKNARMRQLLESWGKNAPTHIESTNDLESETEEEEQEDETVEFELADLNKDLDLEDE